MDAFNGPSGSSMTEECIGRKTTEKNVEVDERIAVGMWKQNEYRLTSWVRNANPVEENFWEKSVCKPQKPNAAADF